MTVAADFAKVLATRIFSFNCDIAMRLTTKTFSLAQFSTPPDTNLPLEFLGSAVVVQLVSSHYVFCF